MGGGRRAVGDGLQAELALVEEPLASETLNGRAARPTGNGQLHGTTAKGQSPGVTLTHAYTRAAPV